MSLTLFFFRAAYTKTIVWGMLLFLFLVGGLACYQLYAARSEQIEHSGQHLVDQTSQSISMWLTTQGSLAKILAVSPCFREVCRNPSNEEAWRKAENYLRLVHKEHPEYNVVALVPFFDSPEFIERFDAAGTLHKVRSGEIGADSIEGRALGKGGLNLSYVSAIHEGKSLYLSEAKFAPVEGIEPASIMATAVYDDNGKVIGAVFFGIRLSALSNFFSGHAYKDEIGELEIIDSRGLIVSHYQNARVLNQESEYYLAQVLERIAQGETHFSLNDGGKLWEYSVAPIEFPGSMSNAWWVLFQVDVAKQREALIVPFAVILFLCLFGGLVMSLLMRSSEKALQRNQLDIQEKERIGVHRLYTQNVPYGIALLDGNNTFQEVNPAAELMLGAVGSLLGKNAELIFEPDSNMALEILGSEHSHKYTNVLLVKGDENKEVFDIIATPLPYNDVNYMLLTFFPVPSTRDYEERMRATYSASVDHYLTFVSDEQGNMHLADITQGCMDLLKMHTKPSTLEDILEYAPQYQPDGTLTKDKAAENIAMVLEQGFARLEWLHQASDGVMVPCELTLIRFSHGGYPAIMVCLRSLEEQKKNEEALRKERGMLSSMLDNIPGIIFLQDAQGRYVTVNQYFSYVLEMDLEFVKGKTDDELLPPELAEFCHTTNAAARITDGPYYFEQSLTAPDGSERAYLFSKQAFYKDDGDYDGVLAVGMNITRLKEAEKQIAIAKAMAEEASSAKSEFLARMSHEIRTPMNAIIGMCYLCLKTDLKPDQLNFLRKIKGAADHLMGLINSILDFSKIESGKMESESIVFSVRETLAQVESMLVGKAEQLGVDLVVECDADVPDQLEGDALHLGQVLINLASNALKFTTEGEVQVLVELQNSLQEQVCLHLSVSDTGIGISEDQIARLFDPFTQASSSTARLYGGSGLGLAICKSLVELMDGKIWVESEVGKGSTFHVQLWLRLPLASAITSSDNSVQIQSVPPMSEHPGWGGKLSLLLVEDNFVNQEVAKAMLNMHGLDVHVATNGLEGLNQFEESLAKDKPFALVLMDMQMPIMDGLESTESMRALADPRAQEIPIIAMTANAMEEDRRKCLDAGMNDHIGKPIEPALLFAVLFRNLPPA